MRALTVISLVLLAPAALAQSGGAMLFGPEFTFTNPGIVEAYGDDPGAGGAMIRERREALRARIDSVCSNRDPGARNFCRIRFTSDDLTPKGYWQVEYPNIELDQGRGTLRIVVTEDPYVIETQTTPMTRQEWIQNKSILQNDLFDQAAAVNMRPDRLEGGGHINVGFEYFRDRPHLLSAYVADFAAHPELAMGGFGIAEPDQALPFASLPRKERQRLAVLARQLREAEITADTFVEEVQKIYKRNNIEGRTNTKYHALNLDSAGPNVINEGTRRIEIRSVAAQRNMEDFINDITLVERRVEHLRTEASAGRYPDPVGVTLDLRNPDPEDLARRMRAYVEEMGLPWTGPGGYGERARAEWGEVVDTVPSSGPGPGCARPAEFLEGLVRAL